jgi:hypothetical protein
MSDAIALSFADTVLRSSSVNPIKDCYEGIEHISDCLSTAPEDADPRFSPDGPIRLDHVFKYLFGNRLMLLSEADERNTALLAENLSFGGKSYWVSVEITEPGEVERFMLNSIEWVNPIAAVVPSSVVTAGIACSDVHAFLIRAYDDDGFILVLLK